MSVKPLRQGSVPAGYKQTEVGEVPDDWHVQQLKELVAIKSGQAFSSAHFSDKGPILLTPGNFKLDGGLYFNDRNTKRYSGPYVSTMMFDHDDLLIVMTDLTPDCNLLGKPAFVRITEPILHNQRIGKIVSASSHISLGFLYWYFLSDAHARRMKETATGSTVRHTSNGSIYSSLIALPPTKAEQEAIAEALSDADALIESMEQLLAKKRQLKQGAMQELLTGKKRLPGFSGKWEVKRLDELGRWTGGMTPSMRNPDYWQSGTVPWISSGDVKSTILTSTAFAISEYAIKRKATTLLPAKSIIVVTRSGILRKYLPVAMNMIPMAINQDIKALLPNDHALAEYLLHAFTCNGERILARCLKSGTTVESVEFPWLKAFTIPIPPIAEQTAIAAILSDMDAEITALEAKLAKARRLKQGMMQELLTGRIRLV